jgi:MYXO-CTERM domain-containing protein
MLVASLQVRADDLKTKPSLEPGELPMSRSIAKLLAVAILPAASFFVSSPAYAGIESCGNIDVSANANCKVEVQGGCTAQCQPLNFTASCSAELYASCNGMCNGTATASCTGGCQAGCEAECNVDPGSFECDGACRADCSANCAGQCTASANQADCEASCRSTCSGECSAQCELTPAMADCTAQCEMCCTGSCNAEANFQCQIDCQASGYAQCRANLQGGCEAQCTKPEGALFCDSQYVDAGNNLEECLNYLEGVLKIDVEGWASGSAECNGNTCTAEGEAGIRCATAPPSHTPFDGRAVGFAALGLGLLFARRRRS